MVVDLSCLIHGLFEVIMIMYHGLENNVVIHQESGHLVATCQKKERYLLGFLASIGAATQLISCW